MYINAVFGEKIFLNDIHAFFSSFFFPATLVKICTGGIRETCNQLGMALLVQSIGMYTVYTAHTMHLIYEKLSVLLLLRWAPNIYGQVVQRP